MGRVKEQMLIDQQDQDLVNFFEILLKRDELTGALNGIAKYIVSNGISSIKLLSSKQKAVVDRFIEGYKSKYFCKKCGNDNTSYLTDYIEIADDGELCSSCQHDREKFMAS